jgi:phosphate uptake regulator
MAGMLRELISAWRGRDLLSEMLTEFQHMLEDAEWMFTTVGDVLEREVKPQDVHEDFFARDKKINAAEKNIRRRIVEHLSLRRDADVPACLVLMSVVKDAERIGDFCKNIYEVACLYTMNFDHGPYITPLRDLRAEIESIFSKARVAFSEADQASADAIIKETRDIAKHCDEMIAQLINDKLPTQKAVAYTLLSRYFKRVASHLANICSSVTGPVHEMDHTKLSGEARKTYGKEA